MHALYTSIRRASSRLTARSDFFRMTDGAVSRQCCATLRPPPSTLLLLPLMTDSRHVEKELASDSIIPSNYTLLHPAAAAAASTQLLASSQMMCVWAWRCWPPCHHHPLYTRIDVVRCSIDGRRTGISSPHLRDTRVPSNGILAPGCWSGRKTEGMEEPQVLRTNRLLVYDVRSIITVMLSLVNYAGWTITVR